MEEMQDKPRKLEDDIAEYLIKIESQFSLLLENNDEDKYNLIDNVLIELSNRFASASCDKRTNFLIEKFCNEANLKQLLEIIQKVTPYSVFLARNRYSSHILQVIIGRMCYVLKYEDFVDNDVSYVIEVLEKLCNPIMKEICWLMTEQSASHVLRSMICLLAGIPTIAERKGKNSKHQHSISLSENLSALIEPNLFYISSSVCYSVPTSFHEILIESFNALLSLSTKEIEKLIADFSSSAVLNLFIRILANPGIITSTLSVKSGPKLLQRLFCISFGFSLPEDDTMSSSSEWDNNNNKIVVVPDTVQYVFYAMAGDRAGSYFLEGVIECCSVEFLLAVVSISLLNKCKEYISDSFGNFVVQAILRRISSVFINNKTKLLETNKNLIVFATKLINEIIASDYFSQLVTSKGGVALWLLTVSRNLSDISIGENLAIQIINTWILSINNIDSDESITTATAKAVDADFDMNDINLQQCISKFLSTKLVSYHKEQESQNSNISKNKKNFPTSNTFERDSTQVLIAKLTGELMRSQSNKVSHLICKSFSQVTLDSLKYIATSGAVSRAVLDVFLELFSQTTEFKLLGINLSTLGVELAQHFVGQHIVRKYFELADLRGKEKWALALTSSGNSLILTRNKEGNATLKLMNAELYQRDPIEWRSTIKRKLKAENMLKELDSTLNSKHKSTNINMLIITSKDNNESMNKQLQPLTSITSVDDNIDDSNNTNNKTLRKRKRKRPNKSNSTNNDES